MERSVLELKALLLRYGWKHDPTRIGIVQFEVWSNGLLKTDLNFKEVFIPKRAFMAQQLFENMEIIIKKFSQKNN